MRIYLQSPIAQGKTPKFCQLQIQKDLLNGWSLIREYGNQGYAGKVSQQTFENRDEAIEALELAKDELTKKGFKIVFAQGESPLP